MQYEVKEIDSIKRQISVTVEPAELGEIEADILKMLKKSAQIPGFRPGRTPLGLIKKSYADVIKKEILEKTIPEYYSKVLEKADLNPIAQGSINILKFDDVESGMDFEITVEVEPEIELKKYKGLKADKEMPVVTESMLDAALLDLRKNFATATVVDEAKEGHFITFDMQQLGDGDVPLIGQKMEDLNVEIGAGEFDPELEKQLVGLKTDSDSIVRKTVPANPDADDKSEKVESYKITVKSIQERDIPPLDDELVQNLQDDDINSLDELKDRMQKSMKQNLERRSTQQLNQRIIDELLKENPFDVPETMVENYLERIMGDIRQKHPGEDIDEEQVRQKYRVEAIYLIRWHMLKKQIAKAEKITVTPDEVVQRIDLTPYSEEEKQKLKENLDFVYRLQDDMLEEKIVKLLNMNANITEIFPEDAKDALPDSDDKKATPKKTKKSKKDEDA